VHDKEPRISLPLLMNWLQPWLLPLCFFSAKYLWYRATFCNVY